MPRALNNTAAQDLIAYVLQQNGFPAGAEDLASDVETLKSMAIVRNP